MRKKMANFLKYAMGLVPMMFVETYRHVTYPLEFLLIKLILILLVATASVKKVFRNDMSKLSCRIARVIKF